MSSSNCADTTVGVCHGARPDLTFGLEDYILILIPAAALLLLAPVRLRNIWSRSRKVVTPTALWWAKIVSSILFVGFSFAVLVRGCIRRQNLSTETPAAAVAFVASLAAATLSQWEHLRSIKPSGLLQIYLMVALVVQAVHLRSVWLRQEDGVKKGLGIAQIISCALFLAVESVSKESILLHRENRSPQDVNGLFSQRLFWWLNNLFKRGYRSVLAPNDLDKMDEDLASTDPQRRFRLEWRKHQAKNPDGHLFVVVVTTLRYDFLFPVVPRLLWLGATFSQPFLILRFINYIEDPDKGGTEEGILLVLATALQYTAIATSQAWYWQSVTRFQVKLRGCLINAIHDKALRSRPDSKSSPMMLMNVDVEKTLMGMRFIHEFWSCGIAIGVGLGLLYRQTGLPFIAPIILLVVLIGIASSNGTKIAPKTKEWLAATQTRVSYITNVIGSMKNIKLLGIGSTVLEKGNDLRRKEVEAQKAIRLASMINLIISLTNFPLATLVLYGAFAIKTHFTGVPLTNGTLFSSLAVLRIFTGPILETIQFLPLVLQVFAALSRIQTYLKSSDHQDQRIVDPEAMGQAQKSKAGVSIFESHNMARIRGLACGYSKETSILTDTNCDFVEGDLSMVVGSVGSGKSTLLKALLGEVEMNSGSVTVTNDEISYCSQAPWLWNGTIQENIVGARDTDEAWLDKVLWACGLDQDIRDLPQGLFTRVGNDGTALSGGQKNRISLARAIYPRTAFVVLDDILSGLDTRTERLVFNRVLAPRGLLKSQGSTVVLATHSVGWLRFADKVVVLEDGSVSYQGSPEYAPARLIRKGSDSSHDGDEDATYSSSVKDVQVAVSPSLSSSTRQQHSNRRLYKTWLKSFGAPGLALFAVVMVGFSVLQALQTLALKWWASAEPTTPEGLGKWVGILAAITIAFVVDVAVTLYVAFIYLFPKSSLYLHAQQFKALIRVRYSAWGDKETGSVANRFSQDIALVDTQLSASGLNVAAGSLDSLASIAIILVATPFIAASFPFLIGVFWVIQSIYLRTSKQLRVMDLEAKAPLCTHFLETVSGVATVKTFGWSRAYMEKNAILLERSQVPYYLLESVQNWLTLVLSLVVAGLATVVMAIVVKMREKTDAGYVALALINIMELGPIFQYVVMAWTQLETSMGAIARGTDFIESTPEEERGSINPPSDWLSRGEIRLSHLEAAYSDSAAPTIKDINLRIRHGEKIALCGRTGSGKSSLASAVFGLLHITDGIVEIDGFDITKVSQDLLRSKMIALPQDPYFTLGTVRENLILRKSEASRSDDQILQALDRVGLLGKFETLAATSGETWLTPLDVELNPDEMLTKGQTQLFAMARAILSDGQIVLIDEATSGLDRETEELVQKLLRTELAGRTIIAIAHHLQTILDFDTVVVLDNGRIAEMGKPSELKEKQGSLFGELLRAAE